MKDIEPKTCCYCEKPFHSFDRWASGCPECEAEHERKEIEKSRVENRDRIMSEIPPLFQATDINHAKFNSAAWAKIKDHRLSDEQPWIGFVGMTGRCKTRLAYLYATEEVQRQAWIPEKARHEKLPNFAFVTSYQIGENILKQYGDCSGTKHRARAFLDKLRSVEVLLIDDLGKGRLTPAVASELFALIDHRHAHLSHTIWTSNSAPEVIAEGLPEDMAGPFAGRIIESSRIFTFK